jgi:hypothetical protein
MEQPPILCPKHVRNQEIGDRWAEPEPLMANGLARAREDGAGGRGRPHSSLSTPRWGKPRHPMPPAPRLGAGLAIWAVVPRLRRARLAMPGFLASGNGNARLGTAADQIPLPSLFGAST